MSKITLRQRRSWSWIGWDVRTDPDTKIKYSSPPVVVEEGIGCIASFGFGGPGQDHEGFARLMSAAPDLLFVVEDLVADYQERFGAGCASATPLIERAQRAIDKAVSGAARSERAIPKNTVEGDKVAEIMEMIETFAQAWHDEDPIIGQQRMIREAIAVAMTLAREEAINQCATTAFDYLAKNLDPHSLRVSHVIRALADTGPAPKEPT